MDPVDMPQDLISEMLMKLPVKTLCRFKTVCKVWLVLISNPRFQLTQYRKLAVTRNYVKQHSFGLGIAHTLLNYSRHASLVVYNHSLTRDDILPDELMWLFKNSRDNVQTIGPIYGVYLVHDFKRNAALWNHATQEYKILSKESICKSKHIFVYGFGYEDMVDGGVDFLVMKLHLRGSDTKEKGPKLYRSSAGLWKELNPLPKEYNCGRIRYPSVHINGVFYWVDSGNGHSFLGSFDTKTETFGKSDFPNHFTDRRSLTCYESCGKKLLAFIHNDDDEQINLWVMKESSWVKEATIVLDELQHIRGIGAADHKADTWLSDIHYDESLFPVSLT